MHSNSSSDGSWSGLRFRKESINSTLAVTDMEESWSVLFIMSLFFKEASVLAFF
jgi:hypothetical protein